MARSGAARLPLSSHISLRQAETLVLAEAHAHARGWRLNRFVTLAFDAFGCPLRTDKALAGFLKDAGDWLRWHGAPTAWIWVREAPPGKSEHAHLLIHVPDHLAAGFARRQRGWITRTGTTFRKGVVYTRPVRDITAARAGILRYLLKGGDEQVRDIYGIEDRGHQGDIIGKRCGVSESLGATARARDGGVVGAYERPTVSGIRAPSRQRASPAAVMGFRLSPPPNPTLPGSAARFEALASI